MRTQKGGGNAWGNLKEWPRNRGRASWTCYVHVMSQGEGFHAYKMFATLKEDFSALDTLP